MISFCDIVGIVEDYFEDIKVFWVINFVMDEQFDIFFVFFKEEVEEFDLLGIN